MSNMTPITPNPAPVPPITPVVPIPSNVPAAWLATISSVAGVIAFGILPVIHHYFPDIPTMDVTVVQAALGILISVAIVLHNFGWQAALKHFADIISPQLTKAVEVAVAAQVQNNNAVGPLSVEDVVAVKHARYARLNRPTNRSDSVK